MAERYYYGTGRRKSATARVRLYPEGNGIVVNEKPAEEHFSREIDLLRLKEPLLGNMAESNLPGHCGQKLRDAPA